MPQSVTDGNDGAITSMEIIIKGTNSQGGTFYYTGILTFHGNGNGTLVLENG